MTLIDFKRLTDRVSLPLPITSKGSIDPPCQTVRATLHNAATA